jgi:hypothetical protein
MTVHFVLITLYMVSVLGSTILIFYYIGTGNKGLQFTDLEAVFYTIDVWLQFFDEVIIVYLVLTFASPLNDQHTDSIVES